MDLQLNSESNQTAVKTDPLQVARALANLLRQTPEYEAFLKALQAVNNDVTVQKLSAEMRAHKTALQWGGDTDGQHTAQFTRLELEIGDLPAVKEYHLAEIEIGLLLRAVDDIISQEAGVAFADNAQRIRAVLVADKRTGMELTEEIKIAARELGQSLRQDNYVHTYVHALKETRTDPEASALEKRMYGVYEALIAHQQAGDQLNQDDTRLFYDLRQRVQIHPLISKRNDMLRLIKPYLAQIAEEISSVLGVDYTALARPQ